LKTQVETYKTQSSNSVLDLQDELEIKNRKIKELETAVRKSEEISTAYVMKVDDQVFVLFCFVLFCFV
jgi:phage-related protein